MRNRIAASEGASTYLLGLCGASILNYAFTMIMAGRGGYFAGMSVGSWISYALIQVAFIAVVFTMGKVRRVDMIAACKIRPKSNWKQYALLPFIAFATILVFYPLALGFMALLGSMGYPITSVISIDFSSVGTYFLALFLIAVLPAFGEELLCRGALLNGLNTRNVVFGILISSLLFSLMHANPLQTVHQFGLGVVLAIIAVMSGSLIPCIIVHFLNNFYTLTVSAYIPQADAAVASLGYWNFLTGIASVIVGLFMLIALFYAYKKLGEPKKKGLNYRVHENTIIFDEFSLSATSNEDFSVKTNPIKDFFVFFGSLFTKRGIRQVIFNLQTSSDVPAIGKQQPMINVWLALGFASIYWIVNLILGLI